VGAGVATAAARKKRKRDGPAEDEVEEDLGDDDDDDDLDLEDDVNDNSVDSQQGESANPKSAKQQQDEEFWDSEDDRPDFVLAPSSSFATVSNVSENPSESSNVSNSSTTNNDNEHQDKHHQSKGEDKDNQGEQLGSILVEDTDDDDDDLDDDDDDDDEIAPQVSVSDADVQSMLANLHSAADPAVWCRYCGARASLNFEPGPWGEKQLCNHHYADWNQKLLQLPLDEPKQPVNPSANTEVNYAKFLCRRDTN